MNENSKLLYRYHYRYTVYGIMHSVYILNYKYVVKKKKRKETQ